MAWTASKDNVGVVSYSVYLGTSTTPQAKVSTTSARLRGLSCGTAYRVTVVAADKAGNKSPKSVVTVTTRPCPDTTAPSMPTAVEQVVTTATSVVLAWSPSSDNTGVTGYGVYAGGLRSLSTVEPSATISGLSCGSTRTYGLDAVDAAGNRSAIVDVVVQTTACASAPAPPPSSPPAGGGGGGGGGGARSDSTAPSTPGTPSVVSASASSLNITWSGSTDNVAVVGYGVYVNGQRVASASSTSTVVGGLACGTTYTLAVDAFDSAGNQSTKSQTMAATNACTDAQAPSTPTGVVTLARTTTSISLQWAASTDNVGVTGYGAYLDGTRLSDTSATTFIFAGLLCGTSHTLGIDATDGAGNRSSQTVVMVSTLSCPDTTPPSAVTGLSATNPTTTSIALSWSASTDNTGVAGYKVSRNGSVVGSVTATSTTQSGLTCGTSYTFAVAAFDAAQNLSPSAQIVGKTADCAPPPPPPPAAPGVSYPASYFTGPLGSQNFVPQKQGAFLIDYPGGVGQTWEMAKAAVQRRELDMGRKFDGIEFQYWGGGTYQGQSNCIDTSEINEQREQWIQAHGAMPIISWSPYRSIAEINSGAVDACIAAAAAHFKQDGFPVMIRLWWEFDNTAGFPWSVGQTSNIGAPFIAAWRRVVGIFRQQGATNVGFWWTPLEGSPDRAGINSSYPGDAYVDWVGSDVYNTCLVGETSCWSSPLHSGWATFADAAAYTVSGGSNQYDLWSQRKPFVYGEVGVAYDPAAKTLKGDWFRAIPGTFKTKLPLAVGLSFFDQDVSALEGARSNWLVDYPTSTPDVYAGFKQMAADPWLNTRG